MRVEFLVKVIQGVTLTNGAPFFNEEEKYTKIGLSRTKSISLFSIKEHTLAITSSPDTNLITA
jgi:hypothetical protein